MPTFYRQGQRIDHYEIIEPLGQGVASHSYRCRLIPRTDEATASHHLPSTQDVSADGQISGSEAWDQQAQGEVVLKFPLDELIGGRAIFERYRREAEIGRLLHHPHIQCHMNQDEVRSTEYLVLEYLPGRTLRAVMMEQAPELLSTEDILRILIQVGDALIYAHEQGIVHRDIKPENIIVLETGEIKIIDFGIALLEKEQTPYRRWRPLAALIGTPDYMAPERLRGATGDARADIYAMGIMLYELLCGQLPFKESDDFTFTNQRISHDPPDIRRFNTTLASGLATVVMRAIRRNPEQRYAAMRDMLFDLCHLDMVTAIDYVPVAPLFGGRYRPVLRLALLILVICLGIIAFGLLAQFAHPSVLK